MNIYRLLILLVLIAATIPASSVCASEPTHEALVVDYTEGYQLSISSSGSDKFLVAYERYDNVNYAQLWALGLDNTGRRLWHRPIGFQRCNAPSVSTLDDGSFVVTFRYVGSSSGIPQVLARRFLVDGTAEAILRLVSGDVSSSHSPGSASGPGSGFTIAWVSGNAEVKTQVFSPVGAPLSTPVIVSDGPAVPRRVVSMARTDSGISAYAWFSDEPDGSAIRGRILDAERNPVTSSFLVTDYRNARSGIEPAVEISDTGGLLIAWSDRAGVRYSRYALDGTEMVKDHLVTPDGEAPLASMTRDGAFAVGGTGSPATVSLYESTGVLRQPPISFGTQLPFESGRSGELLLLEDGTIATALLEANDGTWPDQVYFGWVAPEPTENELFDMDFDPDTLNLGSNGRYVTATLTPSAEASINEINGTSVLLGSVAPSRMVASESALTLKFPRPGVAEMLMVGMQQQVLLSGTLMDGTPFSAGDSIRVIDPQRAGRARISAEVAYGTTEVVTWPQVYGDPTTQYDGYLTLDGGQHWEPLFSDVTGENVFVWEVNASATPKAIIIVEGKNSRGIYHAQTPPFQIRKDGPFRELHSQIGGGLRAHPNPFNPATEISFTLRNSRQVALQVYDLSGRLVRTLVDDHLVPGTHYVTWNGTDDSGRPVASGVYLYQLKAGNYTETKRMVLLK